MRSFDDVYRMRPDQLQMGFLKGFKRDLTWKSRLRHMIEIPWDPSL